MGRQQQHVAGEQDHVTALDVPDVQRARNSHLSDRDPGVLIARMRQVETVVVGGLDGPERTFAVPPRFVRTSARAGSLSAPRGRW